ncbi:dihydrolipoyl dehydrogenase, partial [Geobacillus zalihae]|uniref:dihydrolipoyl dehydrogenase n=1 Tax=Geobacillus zalihae TaxID=213419 RepID=UPI0009C1A341
MAKEYDVVILGGGTGGYVAAIRASQLGLKTAVVEKGKLGGTCLHAGCIPSKALLRSAEVYAQTKNGEAFGVIADGVRLDFAKVQARKAAIVEQLHKGVQHLMKKGKIDVYAGTGRLLGPSIFSPLPGTVSVEMNDGSENEMLVPKFVVIATGSRPRTLPGLEPDGEFVMTSDEALQMVTLPSSILIVGGGVIGMEWASMLNDFGVDVTVLEYADRILPTEDEDVSKEMEKLLRRRGVNIVTGARVLAETLEKGNGVTIQAEHQGERKTFNTDIVIEKGYIQTNEFGQTKEAHIYAIGDVIGGLQLAHVAAHEGIVAIEHLAGHNPAPIDYTMVPRCIYTRPEAAAVGLTEQEAKAKGYDVKVGKFPFKAIGKALVFGEA